MFIQLRLSSSKSKMCHDVWHMMAKFNMGDMIKSGYLPWFFEEICLRFRALIPSQNVRISNLVCWKNPVESRTEYVPVADGRMKRTGQKKPSFTHLQQIHETSNIFQYTWICYELLWYQCLEAEYLCRHTNINMLVDSSAIAGSGGAGNSSERARCCQRLNGCRKVGESTFASNSRIHVYASRDHLISRKIITINLYQLKHVEKTCISFISNDIN